MISKKGIEWSLTTVVVAVLLLVVLVVLILVFTGKIKLLNIVNKCVARQGGCISSGETCNGFLISQIDEKGICPENQNCCVQKPPE